MLACPRRAGERSETVEGWRRGVEEEMFTVAEVAAQLRVTPETVRVWLRRHELEGVRLARKAGWRITASALQRFVARHTPPTPPET
jgi:excisionase family DNA binding protein